jgi:hypothetical protein
MAKRVSQMSDEELRAHMNRLAPIAGKAARKSYMVALDEAIRRESAGPDERAERYGTDPQDERNADEAACADFHA